MTTSPAPSRKQALRALFEGAGFRDVETLREVRVYSFPSFDAFFRPVEQGVGFIGREWMTLAEGARALVREDVRRELEAGADPHGAVGVPFEVAFVGGRKP